MAFKTLFGQNRIFYGADYNPEQWLDSPEILEKDLELMKQAHCSIMSVGIFSWSKLEPSEGVYNFEWLDKVLDDLNRIGVKVFLATPSGARPGWLSKKYPEVLRVWENRVRALHGGRHNHCASSPVYREKVQQLDRALAERYANHPAVLGWHISNEFSGSCHCELCQKNFREWLKKKYKTLDNLNKCYWSTFWSHTYSSWDEIESPSTIGENAVHALNLDWKRFNTQLCMDFCKMEIDTVKSVRKDLPATTNFMEFFYDYDYFEFAKILDFISWDSYPEWHVYDDQVKIPAYTAMNHDLMRSLKGGMPFVLMESTPNVTNWRELSKQKKPGMIATAAVQALAHGADNIQYFQWRKSRGSSEKFHGAFVDHVGHLETRVGKEMHELGEKLEKLGEVTGSLTDAKIAIVFDTVNRWAIDDAQGPRNKDMHYLDVCLDYYKALWSRGINVDVIDQSCPLDKYKVVIAPMTYMLRGDYATRVEKFVKNGGHYVSTFWSGIVDENDLCFLGGFPGPLKDVLGIWDEEIECLDDEEKETVRSLCEALDFNAVYDASMLCSVIHAKGASVLASFDSDYFKDSPALTVNSYGKGKAYYVAARMDDRFTGNFIQMLLNDNSISSPISDLPEAMTCHTRYNEGCEYLFIENYADTENSIVLKDTYFDMSSGRTVSEKITLSPYQAMILKRSI
ncbi:MAG: beta-galactosidase [Succinivibrio sp.]